MKWGHNINPRTGWHTVGAVFGALALIYASWHKLFLFGRVPVDGNMITLSFPQWAMFRDALLDARLPLWNAARNLGEPHLADPQTMALYPPMWLCGLLDSYLDYLRCWVFLHTVLAGAFAAALAHSWTKKAESAILAAMAVGIGASLTARVTFPNHFAAASWMPAVFWFVSQRRWRSLAVAFAMQCLAGFPPILLMTGLVAALGVVLARRRDIPAFAASAALGAGLSAVLLLPFLEFMRLSVRPALLPPESAAAFSVPPAALLKMSLLPQWIHWLPESPGDPAIMTFYGGPILVGLAAWAAWRGGRLERTLTGAVVGACALSLGGFLPGYRFMPFLRVFRFPANWLLPAAVGLALAAACGAAKIPRKRWRWALLAFAALDLIAFNWAGRVAWARPGFLTDTPALAGRVNASGSHRRIYHTERLGRTWKRYYLTTADDYLSNRDFLAPSFGAAHGVDEVASYQTLLTRVAARFRSRLASERDPRALLQAAGVSVVVDLDDGAGERMREALRTHDVPNGFERVFSYPVNPKDHVSIVDYEPGRVVVDVEASEPRRVVLAETLLPGWRALVDGKRVQPAPFENIFIAVPIDAGTHRVAFEYSPRSFWIGLLISLTALGSLLFTTYRGARGF